MKKFLTILIAGFIGFLGIFTTTSTAKNSAEPQYFLQNERKNAVVIDNTTEVSFYLDSNIDFISTSFDFEALAEISENSIVYIDYYLTDGTTYTYDFTNLLDTNYSITEYELILTSDSEEYNFNFYNSEEGNINLAYRTIDGNWKSRQIYVSATNSTYFDIKGFTIKGLSSINNELILNTEINTYIGNLTSLDSDTNQNTTIEQIGNIINDTTKWFVNIFIGLSNIFYSNGTLGVWGSVLFLGVAFTLITMCLKWVISSIRGI